MTRAKVDSPTTGENEMLQDTQRIAVVGTRADEDGVWTLARVREHFGQRAVDALQAAAAAGMMGCMFQKVEGDRATGVMLTISGKG